jgi:hypothetical protein
MKSEVRNDEFPSPASGTAEGSLRSSGAPTGVPLAGERARDEGLCSQAEFIMHPRPSPQPLVELLAIRLGRQTAAAKSLVISRLRERGFNGLMSWVVMQ